MHNPLRIQLLDNVVSIITLARPCVEAIARKDRDLANQLRRALSSIGLNIAEGFGTAAGNSRLRFETARGSLNESVTALRIAVAWGHISPHSCAAPLAALDRLGAKLYRVTHR